jgi:hypothetical protein
MRCGSQSDEMLRIQLSNSQFQFSSWPGFVPAIHVLAGGEWRVANGEFLFATLHLLFDYSRPAKSWMPGTSPGMTSSDIMRKFQTQLCIPAARTARVVQELSAP